MAFGLGSRVTGHSPGLFLVLAASVALAGCASTGPVRPPVAIATGEPREPVEPGKADPADVQNDPGANGDQALADLLGALGQGGDGGYTPAFMRDRELTRLAVLLPFSHPNAQVRREAEGLLAGAELALFERGSDNILLMPKDTRGSRAGAEEAIREAVEQGADAVIGPLFAENVRTVSASAREADIPVIAFSTDRSAAGGGAYLIAISPEAEIARVVDYAASHGTDTFAFLGPATDYGRRAEQALRVEAARRGAAVIASEMYDPANEAPVDEARRLADALRSDVEARPGRVAVLIPERGLKLLAVAPLLPYYDVDVRRLTLMGIGAWNDPSVWREPTLLGAIFAAPDPQDVAAFGTAYSRVYRTTPPDLASLGYDAGALAMGLSGVDALSRQGIESRDGFRGVNGAFRFRIDGTADRGLAVLQITPGGAAVVEAGVQSFGAPGS